MYRTVLYCTVLDFISKKAPILPYLYCILYINITVTITITITRYTPPKTYLFASVEKEEGEEGNKI